MRKAVAGVVVAAVLVGATAAPVRSAPETPESRLLTVWLDLTLLGIFYPETTPRTFRANLKKIVKAARKRTLSRRLKTDPCGERAVRASVGFADGGAEG